jgi:uncharacterized membrane protein
MNSQNAVVAMYATHQEAEAAIQELQRSGFEMKKLSIIGRDYHTEEHVVGYYNVGDRMKAWGRTGAFWGGLWGILFGSAFFWIPGLGPTLAAGPLVTWIVGALEGAVVMGGLSAFGAALYTIGVPRDSILRYETALKTGKFILIAHGTAFDTTLARDILNRTRPEALDHHLQLSSELRTAPALPPA